MAQKRKGHPAWNKGLPKEKQPMFWKKHTEKTKKQISDSERGKVLSDKTKNKISEAYVLTKARLKNITKLGKSQNGKNSSHWKGGVSRAYKTGYWSIEYRAWRKSVFERDNFECQKCSQKRGKYITAHHIKSWRNYPKLRYKISNGITLCEECHSKTDNYKGRVINSLN